MKVSGILLDCLFKDPFASPSGFRFRVRGKRIEETIGTKKFMIISGCCGFSTLTITQLCLVKEFQILAWSF